MEDHTALRRCELFRGLPEEAQSELEKGGTLRSYDKGQVILAPQERLDHLGVMTAGRIHQMHISQDGEYRLMTELHPPQTVGADLISTRTRLAPYHVVAAEESCIFWIPVSLLTSDPTLKPWETEILRRLLRMVSHINMKKEYRLAILAQHGLRQRIMTYLTMQADKHRSATVTVPFSREEMASFLCVNRSALSHELSLMEQEGMIKFHKNSFTLCHWGENTDRRNSVF